MLQVHHLSKSYVTDVILKDVTFSISRGERVGLVGPNGCGKTTLLRILTGEESQDAGSVQFNPPDLRWGYLKQGFNPGPEETLRSVLALEDRDLTVLSAEVERLAAAWVAAPDQADLQLSYDRALDRLARASENAGSAPEILAALGLGDFPLDTPLQFFSGGQKTRLGLARVLLGSPQLLFLDEPTNHLDIDMLDWLEDWLLRFQGALLIVSHDRTFLDGVVNRILDLNMDTHTLREYSGNYTAYIEQVQAEHEKQQAAFQDQVAEIRRIKTDIQRTKQQSLGVELSTTPRQPGVRRIAKKVARKALSREHKLERYLESDERVEKPTAGWQMKENFFEVGQTTDKHFSQTVLRMENASIGYAGYPPLLQGINLDIQAGQRIALIGPNGAGKTTLLRTITGRLEPLSGRVQMGPSIHPGYMAQEQELFDPNLTPVEIIRLAAPFNQTEARSFLHYFLFTGDDATRRVGDLSYGERARLSLGSLVAQGCNFLILDEPINHLDIPSRTRFEQALQSFEGAILAVVHDRHFIRQFVQEIWEVKNQTILSSQ